MLLATTSYTVCIVGVILMYIWYAPDSSCLLNIFFITWTLFLIQLMTSIALHPKVSLFVSIINPFHVIVCFVWMFEVTKGCLYFCQHQQVNAGYLTPALMGLYVVFVCWCAIRRYVLCFLQSFNSVFTMS